MDNAPIGTTNDVYDFVERLQGACENVGHVRLAQELDDDLHLGESRLEILGALRTTILNHLHTIESLLGASGIDDAKSIVRFVDRAYGR